MTYEDIYNEFLQKFPYSKAVDYRPADPLYIPQLLEPIPNAIIVWVSGEKSYLIYKSGGKS